MKADILPQAERDLEEAFDYYQEQREGFGLEFLEEFRRGVNQILENPERWQQLDYVFRRYRPHRFPYGLVYKVISERDVVLIEAVMHLSRRPGFWNRQG